MKESGAMRFGFGFGTWRLFLALLVATSHLWAGMLAGPAAYAVWGFFVLSGYLMAHVLNTKYGFDLAGLRNYAHNRFLRIFPGFWVACALGALVLWWLETRGVDARKLNPAFGMPRDWKEWGFLATLLPAFPRWNAPVPVANALSVEVGFYLLMPFMARHRSTALFALAFGLLIAADHGFLPESFGPRYAWFLPAAPAFALGATVFHFRDALRRIAWPGPAVVVWIAHACLTLYPPFNLWPWTVGLYSGAVLSAWVVVALAERRTSRLDDVLGELSYPFYLLHCTAGALLLAWFGYDRSGIYAACGLLLTLAASMAMVRLVDRPLTRRKRPPLVAAAADPATTPDPDMAQPAPQQA